MSLTQPLQQLLENLMALKDDYQAQLREAEYKVNLALEQISHVNALLVDQLGYQELTQSLIALRSHYQSIAAQHQQSATHASSQLAHINALLADQLVLQQSVSIPASNTIKPPEQLQLPNSEPRLGHGETLRHTPIFPPDAIPTDADIDVDHPTDVDASTNIDVDHPTDVDASELFENLDSNEQGNLSSPIKTPMLPEYRHLSKIQAVEKLLRANQGSILHVDYIIRALYGEMDAPAIKDEKPRMYDTLTQGTKKGLWVKVPDSPSCYTIDLKLVPPNGAAKQQSTHVSSYRTTPAKGKAYEQLLPAYKHLNLTSAVESVVHQYAGQILTTEQIAKELFGELSGKTLTQAKNKIGKTLWSGSRQGRWQSIPGKIGCYTLDRKKLKR